VGAQAVTMSRQQALTMPMPSLLPWVMAFSRSLALPASAGRLMRFGASGSPGGHYSAAVAAGCSSGRAPTQWPTSRYKPSMPRYFFS